MMHRINQTSESQQKARAAETADHHIISSDRMPLPSERLIALQHTATHPERNHYLAHIGLEEVTAEPDSSKSQFSPEFLAHMQSQTQFRQSQPFILAQLQRQTQEQQQADVLSFEQCGSSRSNQVKPSEQGHKPEHIYQRLTAQQDLALQGIPTRDDPQNQSSPMMSQEQDGGAIAHYYNPGDMAGGNLGGGNTGENHQLQDYQMQLMLLEQQNKKRLMMARRERRSVRTPSPPGREGEPGPHDHPHLANFFEEVDEPANGMDRSGRISPAPEGQAMQENTTLEDIPHTHHTISEDQTASSGFMRDKLYALDSNSEKPQPAASHFVETQVSPQSAAGATSTTLAHPKSFSRPPKPQIQKQQPSLMARRQMAPAPYQPGIHRDISSPKIHHRALQQTDKEQETRRLPYIDSTQNIRPNIASTMETQLWRDKDGIRNHSTEDKGSIGNLVDNPGMTSASLGEINLLQQLRERIRELEDENNHLCQRKAPEKPEEDVSAINVQIFHHITKHGMVYLSQPYWETNDEEVILRGTFPVSDPEGYVEKKGNIAFIVYKEYDVEHQRGSVDEARKSKKPLPKPEPANQKVLLNSDEMIGAVEAFFFQYPPTFRTDFPGVHAKSEMASPFIWWYHCRESHSIQHLPDRQAKLVATLTNWIEVNYSPLYDQINDQFRRGKVTNASIEYLIRPGDVLISDSEGIPIGHLATSRPFSGKLISRLPGAKELPKMNEQNKLSHRCWNVRSYSYTYAGDFSQNDTTLQLTFETETEDEEIDIKSMGVVPLNYVSRGVRERLERRGKAFWKCRHKQLVSYEGSSATGKYAGHRFMVDFNTYKELHPFNQYMGCVDFTSIKETSLPTDGSEPKAPEIYLFPTLVPGFDLRRKKWTDLEVDQIRDVTWNDQAFSSLVADEDMKELIRALVTSQIAAEKGTDLIDNKGNGLIMLLHGSPGTGKTFTAESVAEIAKKPLYPVTCGDIGTKPEVVEKYLESVFHLGIIWDCVVLLDEAEVFLEQRTLNDLKRNALVSVFLRALEYYEGILILTTNRVGTFDEAFKSRIQLALQYDPLEEHQRKQIWRNFIERLRNLGEEESIDFDDIVLHMGDLAKYPMNGRQIRNSITTARQLARFQKKKMTYTHLKRAITVAEKFDQRLADIRESNIEECNQRVNGRYSDDYIARVDQIR